MSDSEAPVKSRADIYRNTIPSPPESSKTTLPPEAKTAREHWHGIRDIALPAMCLASIPLGFSRGGELFAAVVFVVIAGNLGARKPEGLPDAQALIAALLNKR